MSMLQTPRRTWTIKEFVRIPAFENHELIDGIAVEKALGAEADHIAVMFSAALGAFEDQDVGRVFGSKTGYACFPEVRPAGATLRKPDVSVVLKSRLPGGKVPRDHFTIRPDLAFDAVARHEGADYLQQKLRHYQKVEVPVVVVAYPLARLVVVERPGQPLIRLADGDAIDLGDLLPGLTVAVSDILPRPEEMEEEPDYDED